MRTNAIAETKASHSEGVDDPGTATEAPATPAAAAAAAAIGSLAMRSVSLRFVDHTTEMTFRSSRVAAVLKWATVIFVCTALPGAFFNFLTIGDTDEPHVWVAKWMRATLPFLSAALFGVLWVRRVDQAFWIVHGGTVARYVHFFDALVWSQIIGDLYCNAFVAGASGRPTPSNVFAVASLSFCTGLPWYQHVVFGLSSAFIFFWAQLQFHPQAFDKAVAADVLVGMPLCAVISFLSDRALRQNFVAHHQLLDFGSQLSGEVQQLRGKSSATAAGPGLASLNLEQVTPQSTEPMNRLHHALQRARAVNQLFVDAEARQAMFLAMMSHELRSPLTAMLGSIELMNMEQQNLPAHLRELAAQIADSGAHLNTIVDDVLTFSKLNNDLTPFQLEPVDCCVQDISAAVQRLFKLTALDKGVKFQTFLEDHRTQRRAVHGGPNNCWAWVYADTTRLKQIAVNLVSNAIKFTPPGGDVKLHLRLRDAPATTEFRGKSALAGREPVELEVSVTDTGIGMSPESVKKLFKPFTQADMGVTRNYGGTGLGLAISAQLAVLMHCPKILVESSVGEGTTFRAPLIVATGKPPSLGVPDSRQDDLNACRFIERDDDSFQTPKPGPMTQTDFASAFAKPEELIARASAAAIRPRRNSPPGVSAVQGEPLHGLRVLVVEDSKTIRMVAERLLRRSGCQVVCVENGLEALDAVASSMGSTKSKFDVVLMDYHMPRLGGADATQALVAEHGEAAPVIIGLTANIMDDATTRFKAAGAVAILHKPFHMSTVVATLTPFIGARMRARTRQRAAAGDTPGF
eukprot:INCI5891.3.p1 GENE.INCI5891.3~~INCI5891.3.p1  ORF type:complete len:802 (-),score=127.52 INCI5891.3:179-2584(-)